MMQTEEVEGITPSDKVRSDHVIMSDEKPLPRTITLMGEVNEEKAKEVIERLLQLQNEDPFADIDMYINSFGGCVYSMFAIADMMSILIPDISTINIGSAMSAGAFIFICGTKGKRRMTRNSTLMLHQVSSAIYGTTKDIKIEVAETTRLQQRMIEVVSERSNLDEKEIENLIDRDAYISGEQAIEMGLCDMLWQETVIQEN